MPTDPDLLKRVDALQRQNALQQLELENLERRIGKLEGILKLLDDIVIANANEPSVSGR